MLIQMKAMAGQSVLKAVMCEIRNMMGKLFIVRKEL